MLGKTISHYKIIEKLGEGGMGVVYLAEDLKLGRRVALKLLPEDWTRSSQARARFLHEAQTAASLNHPNICTIYEVEDEGGLVFLAMEHIEGESLADTIARGPMSIKDIVSRGVEIAQGLGAAHERGIVHRDIKPGNVMLTADGRAKVLDFGLALAPEMTRLTGVGRTTGTVSYMSPEQSRGDNLDRRTDIWSLGVVLYEMLTGRRPFSGDHEQAVLRSIINDEAEPPSGLRTGVPLELERVIAKAMAKDPADRYQHVDDLIVDLRAVTKPPSSRMVATVATQESVPAEPRRSRNWLAAAGAVIIIGTLAVWFLYFRAPMRSAGEGPDSGPERVLVAAFSNRSGDRSLDYLEHTLVTAVAEGLASTGVVEVVPFPHRASGSGEPAAAGGEESATHDLRSALDAGASVLVTGSFRVRSDSLHVEARVLDAASGDVMNIIPDESGPLEAPGVAVGKIRSRVMGSLAAHADPTIGADARYHAPTYEAYKEYENSLRYVGIRGQTAVEHLERALELDPEFAYAEVFRIAGVMSVGRDAEADSLIEVMRARSPSLPPVVRLYLDAFEARVHGDHELALRKMREVVRVAPDNFMGRRLLAVRALAVNRPREAIASIEAIRSEQPLTDLYIESWVHGGLANSYHMLGEYRQELRVLDEAIEDFPDLLWLRGRKVRALAALGRVEDIRRVIEEASASPGQGSVGQILMTACRELRAHGHPEEAAGFAEEALAWYRRNLEVEGETEQSLRSLGFALYAAEQWDEAEELFGRLAREHPDYRDYTGYLGTLAARRGAVEEAERVRESILALDEPFDYGMEEYWAACISAQLGDRDGAMDYLRAAYSEGAGLGLHVHQDPDLQPLWDYPPFKRFLEPRD